jgi:signal transduction histidine kinase
MFPFGKALSQLLPTALHALGRHDQLGLLCGVAMVGLTLMLVFELTRFNRRFLEMLRLRFESEQTAQAKTEALNQAHELAQTRSRFVATMSHEVRTPLHGMLGLLGLVHKASHLDEVRRHLELMQSTGDHLVKVINEVLEHARMGATGLPVYEQAFNLREVLQELADMASNSCEDKGLIFSLSMDNDPHELVFGDATRIRQVLHNLLGNALKFTAEGGVTLQAWRDAATGHMRIAIRDTGVGIPADELERIFEPYHQAEGTYERQFGGTGLGLTISRELCAAMGGTLTCTSDVGQGSEFVCDLPLPVALTTSVPYRVSADPVEAALAWLRQHRADTIFMDCEMPGLDGIETTRRIRALERDAGLVPAPIIAMTANGRDTYEERCLPAGMNDYLSKPFGPEALREIVMRQLGHLRKPERAVVA